MRRFQSFPEWPPEPAAWGLIPPRMRGGLVRWIEDGTPPGDFLAAVLNGDLLKACAHADADNAPLLVEYVRFLWAHAPSQCFGGPLTVGKWNAAGGLAGLEARRAAHAHGPD